MFIKIILEKHRDFARYSLQNRGDYRGFKVFKVIKFFKVIN